MMKNMVFAGAAGSVWGIGAVLFKIALTSFTLPTLFGFLFCGAAGFVLFQAALKLGGATEANAFMMGALVIVPLFYGLYMGGELLTILEMLGVLFLVVGTLLIILRQGRNRRISGRKQS